MIRSEVLAGSSVFEESRTKLDVTRLSVPKMDCKGHRTMLPDILNCFT